MNCELVKLEEFSGNEASVYSIYIEEDEMTLYDKFIIENNSQFSDEIKDINKRLINIGKIGAKENFFKIIGSRLTIKGFLVFDYNDKRDEALLEVSKLMKDGKFKFLEDVKSGAMDELPQQIENFYKGKNIGKYIFKIKEN